MIEINDLFFNFDKFYDLVEEGVYIPSQMKFEDGAVLSGALALKHMLAYFENKTQYEKCAKIKEQYDLLMRKIDFEQLKHVDIHHEKNKLIHLIPFSRTEAIDYVYQTMSSGNSHNLSLNELIQKPSHLVTAMIYNTYMPTILQSFAIDLRLAKDNPIMIDMAQSEIYNPDEISYHLIFQAAEMVKSTLG